MTIKICALLVTGIFLSASVFAGTKSQTFDVPADVLYESAVHTAAQTYKLVSSDSSHEAFSFRTGASASSWGLEVAASVNALSEISSRLVLDIQNSDPNQVFSWGAGGRMADKFFKEVTSVLASWCPIDYTFVLVKPRQTDGLLFEDEGLKVRFSVSRKAVNFSLTNQTDSAIRIDWNQVSYVDVDGKSHKVFHRGITYKDRDASLPPSIVPPNATFEDVVLPSDYSQSSDVEGGYFEQDLLPQAAGATSYVGKTISVFAPIEVSGSVKSYLFTLKITDAHVHRRPG